jgi:aspartokinase-like uncharacterized kinase
MGRISHNRISGTPLVVKVGGSLFRKLPDLAAVFRTSTRPLVIVPGGGMFADTVRRMPLDDDSAHWMAVAAMDQYGWCIVSQGLGGTTLLQVPERPLVFLPYCHMRRYDPLPHSWEVTSDSIAAWVAHMLRLDLVLLKSVDGIFENGNLVGQVNDRIKTDVVDPFFIPFVMEKKVPTTVINGSDPARFIHLLQGEQVPGTRIYTTF